MHSGLRAALGDARRAIVLGIGGGGDVVGALASARLCNDLGAETVLGGVAWERIPIDPHAGPRGADDVVDAEALAPGVLTAGPSTRTPDGARFAEARMAELLGEPTLLVDVLGGPPAVAEGLRAAAEKLGADLVVCVDVGGDVLGDGSEPGLASPLCDAIMLAAAARLQDSGIQVVAGIFGPCCDGELSFEELLDRLAALGAAGALHGAWGMPPRVVDELERVVAVVPTEASAQAIRCARGEIGLTTIRRGRRQVTLSALGALTFYFDPRLAVAHAAPLARAVFEVTSLEEANRALNGRGLRTELDYERSALEA